MERYFQESERKGKNFRKQTMEYEMLRLASYRMRPRCYKFPASKLASAGFYYCGEDGKTSCFECTLRVDDWESMELNTDPHEVHQKRAPLCLYQAKNVAYQKHDSELPDKVKKNKKQLSGKSSSTESNPGASTLPKIEPGKCLTYYFRTKNQIAAPSSIKLNNKPHPNTKMLLVDLSVKLAFGRQTTAAAARQDSNALQIVKKLFNDPERVSQGQQSLWQDEKYEDRTFKVPTMLPMERVEQLNLHSQLIRLESFEPCKSTAVNAFKQLAVAGYYYIEKDDVVRRAFSCQRVLRNWQEINNPLEGHRRKFSDCSFVTDPKSCGNIPLTGNLTAQNDELHDAYVEQNVEEFRVTGDGQCSNTCMRETYCKSFVAYSSECITPAGELSETTAFFREKDGRVRCASGRQDVLANWQEIDSPLEGNIKEVSYCSFITDLQSCGITSLDEYLTSQSYQQYDATVKQSVAEGGDIDDEKNKTLSMETHSESLIAYSLECVMSAGELSETTIFLRGIIFCVN